MSRIEGVFKNKDHKALIPYVTIGYPTVEATLRIVPLLVECGSDIIELGIPFSDPIADGSTIQQASFEALQQGVTLEICLEVAWKLRQKVQVPLVFMGYYNPIFHFGLESFCAECARSGVDGLIIPDLPPEEAVDLEGAAARHGIDVIYLLAPTSDERRIDLVARRSRGFVYLVSLTGITGTRDSLPPELEDFVSRVRQKASQPLCMGFGISTPEQARRVAAVTDGIIVGSRVIQVIKDDLSLAKLRSFVTSLRKAI